MRAAGRATAGEGGALIGTRAWAGRRASALLTARPCAGYGRHVDDVTAGAPIGDPRTSDGPAPEDAAAKFGAQVMRAFVIDGRLRSIPAQQRKRAVILGWLLERCFPEDRPYPEREVNMALALVHPDVAALRRYLVDAGLMTRASGEYRRAAPVPASPTPSQGQAPEPAASRQMAAASEST